MKKIILILYFVLIPIVSYGFEIESSGTGGGITASGTPWTDNAIIRSDGTDGSAVQGSGFIITDANVFDMPDNGDIQLGNGSEILGHFPPRTIGINATGPYLKDSSSNEVTYSENQILLDKDVIGKYTAFSPQSDTGTITVSFSGQDQRTVNTINIDGGDARLLGGAGASGSAGDADGGHVYIYGGTGYGTGDPGITYLGFDGTNDVGSVQIGVPASAPTVSANSLCTFYLDESGHNFKAACKYSDGTSKTLTVAFD